MSISLDSVLGASSLRRLASSLPDVDALGINSDGDQPRTGAEASGPVASGVDPGETGAGCRCQPSVERPTGTGVADRRELVVDASACPGKGILESRPGCRATVVAALTEHDVDAVRTRSDGRERTYADESVGLLLAAGRFVERVRFHDESLAERARQDPLAAARRATGRAGAVARIAAESGLAEGAVRAAARPVANGFESSNINEATNDSDAVGNGDDYAGVLRAFVGPTIARTRVARRPPSDASIRETYELPTDADVREAVETVDHRGADE